MFLKIIFRRVGLKENKYLMALIYGGIYLLLMFLILLFANAVLNTVPLGRNILVSVSVGAIMTVVYLVKWELFKFLK
jgi:hypothetical protein